ncbi:hypothetical protein [Paramaledivibacter caminithermalis]|uniref:Uncharacterized protein n=1 Tax=Paramaledivibacter caminithermalis (strain DSM 15212 / CIP 107654 / DViRD3) TaxID=1121301 RepID=A0A1M6RFY8_PARC5|nr:hypothetical protein [Paramaledivibacter caminithermalis]SHK31313.1 hypothetical protein SAMN02745912_02945 [Paramaledivibacter caminithermalis DSM 15212]
MRKPRIIVFLSLIMIFCLNISNVFAYEFYGKPIYRDGVAVIEWHAGLSASTDGTTILHADNYEDATRVTDYDGFMKSSSNDFKGVYHKKEMDIYDYQEVVETANRLVELKIPYDFYNPVGHNETSGYISPTEITGIRCDGFVEYSFEWNNFKVMKWGINGSIWDISEVEDNKAHTWYNMSPKSQAAFLDYYASNLN